MKPILALNGFDMRTAAGLGGELARQLRQRAELFVAASVLFYDRPLQFVRGASKAGQLEFMRTAAIEFAPYGITVNAVLPGNILTEGLAAMGEDYIRTMEAAVPMRRLGSVVDIANAALFFASDEAGYVTGQSLGIDWGQILPESLAAM